MDKDTAILRTQALFEGVSEDTISVRDLFLKRGRDLQKEAVNKNWLSNYIVPLKRFNLIKPIYSTASGRRKIVALKLTLEGASIIHNLQVQGEIYESPITTSVPNVEQQNLFPDEKLTIEAIMKAVPRLKKENPEFNITFSVEPK